MSRDYVKQATFYGVYAPPGHGTARPISVEALDRELKEKRERERQFYREFAADIRQRQVTQATSRG